MRFGSVAEWGAWFKDGLLGLVSILLLAIGVAWLYWMPSSQDTVRRLGLIYELAGAAVVVIEIRKASAKNQRLSVATRLLQYMRRIPVSRNQHAVALGASLSAVLNLSGTGSVTLGIAPGATIEQRVAELEQRAQALQTQVAQVGERVDQEATARAAAVAAEAAARGAAVKGLQEQIKEVETGGLDLSLFGVFWLILGMVLSTATPEVCWVLQWK